MLSHPKVKLACFIIFSIISTGLLIRNGLFMLEERDVSHKEEIIKELNNKIIATQLDQKRLLNELPDLAKKHSTLEKEVFQIRNETKALEITKDNLTKQNELLKQSNIELEKYNSELQNKKNKIDLELAKVSKDLNSKNEELESKQSEYTQLKVAQDLNTSKKKQKAELDVYCASLEANSKQLSEKIAQQQKELEDLHKLSLKAESTKKELANLESKKNTLTQELKDLHTQLKELTTQKEFAQTSLREQQGVLESLKNQSNALKETKIQQQLLTGTLEQLESTLSNKRLELGKLQEEHRNYLSKNTDEINYNNQKISDLKSNLAKESETLNLTTAHIKHQQRVLEELKNSIQMLEEKRFQLSQSDNGF